MNAPYKVHEFRASSGNTCRLKVYPIQANGNQPVDCAWATTPSDPDKLECDMWYALTIGPEYATAAGFKFGGQCDS